MHSSVEGRRVLVVDDEKDVCAWCVCGILTDAGYVVESACDGLEALRRIEARRPDLVVLDLMMPGMDRITGEKPHGGRERSRCALTLGLLLARGRLGRTPTVEVPS